MHVKIRPIGLEFAEDLAKIYRENRDFLRPYEPDRPESFFTTNGQRRHIRRVLGEMDRGLRWTALIYLTGQPAGLITINNILRGVLQCGRVGYWVAEKEGSRGVASTALRLALDVAFCELALHRVEASVRTDNPRSRRVLEKNRFRLIGTARDHVFLDGQWRDEFLMERHSPPISPGI
ncbi:GNAT family protein [Acrocarpospora sp. B8E8]|uniref:GNAT family N-acetyltransferase n=1 Tax=Acrocarpospora sp. B8E8 TaxID=3153572 RepID=UPI00325E1B23